MIKILYNRSQQSLSSPPRAPPSEECCSTTCDHLIIFDKHFDTSKWMLYQREEHRHRQAKQALNIEEDDEDFIP